MKKLSVSEYAKITGVTEKTVRSWIDKGRLPVAMEEVNGRLARRVIVDDNEILTTDTTDTHDTDSIDAEFSSNDTSNVSNVTTPQSLINQGLSEGFVKQILTYVELAGQAKLLTDSEHRTKEEYFKTVQENKILLQDNTELKAEIKYLQEKLKVQEDSKFSNWFKKL